MKNDKISLIISIIALVGVIVLSIDRISNKSEKKDTDVPKTEMKNAEIVFVNIDSVLNRYDLYNVLSLQLIEKQQNLEKELQSKGLSLQNRAYKLQQQYAQHLITTQNYQEKAQKLTDEQMQLQTWQEQKALELNEDQMILTERVYDSIVSAVSTLNADKTYNLVINNATGGTLLYGDPELDITEAVIELLNKDVNTNALTTDTTVSK